MIKGLFNSQARRACEARALRARKPLKIHFPFFFTDFETEKLTVLQSTLLAARHMTIRVIKIVDYISGHKQFDLMRFPN